MSIESIDRNTARLSELLAEYNAARDSIRTLAGQGRMGEVTAKERIAEQQADFAQRAARIATSLWGDIMQDANGYFLNENVGDVWRTFDAAERALAQARTSAAREGIHPAYYEAARGRAKAFIASFAYSPHTGPIEQAVADNGNVSYQQRDFMDAFQRLDPDCQAALINEAEILIQLPGKEWTDIRRALYRLGEQRRNTPAVRNAEAVLEDALTAADAALKVCEQAAHEFTLQSSYLADFRKGIFREVKIGNAITGEYSLEIRPQRWGAVVRNNTMTTIDLPNGIFE